MQAMKPYSDDLRVRIVQAVRDGSPKSAPAHLFGLSLSSIKCYLRIAQRGASLAPRKGSGRPPKTDEAARTSSLKRMSRSVRPLRPQKGVASWSAPRASP